MPKLNQHTIAFFFAVLFTKKSRRCRDLSFFFPSLFLTRKIAKERE